MAELSVLMCPEARVPTYDPSLQCHRAGRLKAITNTYEYTAVLFVVSVIIIIYVIHTANYSV